MVLRLIASRAAPLRAAFRAQTSTRVVACQPARFFNATSLKLNSKEAAAIVVTKDNVNSKGADEVSPVEMVPSYGEVGPAQNQKSPEEMIAAVPPIVVDGNTAICDGGDPALGHPIEYIQLNRVDKSKPSTCKYCGLRYIQKA